MLKVKFRDLDMILIAVVALLIMLQRFIVWGELSNGFVKGSTDQWRYFFLTLAIPFAVLVFGIIATNETEDQSMLQSVFETLALTIYVVIALLNLYTVDGTGSTTAIAIVMFYPLIVIFLAIYRIATWKK